MDECKPLPKTLEKPPSLSARVTFLPVLLVAQSTSTGSSRAVIVPGVVRMSARRNARTLSKASTSKRAE